MTHQSGTTERLTIVCIPVYNDWESATAHLASLRIAAAGLDGPCAVLLVDDGSTDAAPEIPADGLAWLEILRLRRNVGHQRAIAIGLSYLHRHRPCRAVVVMDGDGQDGAQDVPRLLERCRERGWKRIVFARRTRRSENLVFLAGYHAFRVVHRLLTGRRVEVGNFSAIPGGQLDSLVGISELWNHYAAAVLQARLPVDTIPIPRRRRIAGETRMSAAGLVVHGLSAISVYGVTVVVRLLALAGSMLVLGAGVTIAMLCARRFFGFGVPVEAVAAAGFLSLALLCLLVLLLVFALLLLGGRNGAPFLPIRDWEYYVVGLPRRSQQTNGS